MKTTNKIYKVIILMIATLFVGCEYNDTNSDPTKPSEEEVRTVAIMPVMQFQTHKNLAAGLGRISGILMQQWKGNEAQQASYDRYSIKDLDSDAPWRGLFSGSMKDCYDIIKRINGTAELNTRGVAKIYLAVNLGVATNIWGDIPYSEAFLGEENLFPKYDSQESIYKNIIKLLDEAEEDLKASDVLPIQGTFVKLDTNQWIKVANALKARFYLHLMKHDSYDGIQKALGALAKGMSNNADQAVFNFDNNENGGNPLALFGARRKGTMIINKQFETLMSTDPRKDLYMIKADKGDDFLFWEEKTKKLFWSQLNSPGLLITFAEQKFIEAEVLERTGGDGTAAMKDGVKANMEFLNIAASDINTYLATLTLGGTTEEDIKTIIGEKYKALYGNSPIEVWNDYRRTGYPALTPNPDGKNPTYNASGIIPRRLLYPQLEITTNRASVEAAKSAQGGHLLDNYTWIWPNK